MDTFDGNIQINRYDEKGLVGPESGPLPKGASNVTDVNTTPLKGHYHGNMEGQNNGI